MCTIPRWKKLLFMERAFTCLYRGATCTKWKNNNKKSGFRGHQGIWLGAVQTSYKGKATSVSWFPITGYLLSATAFNFFFLTFLRKKKKLKQSWLPALWKKRSKTHKRVKKCFLIGQNRTKHANFQGSPLFQATYNKITEKPPINSTYLVLLDVGGWQKEKARDWISVTHTTLLVSHLLHPSKLWCRKHGCRVQPRT